MRKLLALLLAIQPIAASAAWVENPEGRSVSGVSWIEQGNTLRRRYETVVGTVLHYGTQRNRVDFTPVRVTSGGEDGWRVTSNGWHYFLGQPAGKATDGWVGFGGREGKHWLYQRLVRVGYVFWPDRSFDDIGGAPSYLRGNLSSTTRSVILGPAESRVTVNALNEASWLNLWNLGTGRIHAKWVSEGWGLKEEVTVTSAARTWIAANHPPATAPASTYFAMVYQIDAADIPRWVKNAVVQSIDGDFEDGGTDRVNLENAERELLAFLPVSFAYSADRTQSVRLRKRFYKNNDGNHYIAVGALVSDLNGLPAGDVIFDPTYSTQPDGTAGKDTNLRSSSPTTNFGTDTTIELNTTARNSILEFDLSSLSSEATCTSATLSIYNVSGGGAHTITAYSISAANEAWTEGGATWNTRDGSTAWAGTGGLSTSGTDYESSALGSATYNIGSTGAETAFTLSTTRVKGWFGSSNTNYGVLLIAAGGSDFPGSSDNTTAAYRPKLAVDYTLPSSSSNTERDQRFRPFNWNYWE